MKKLRFFSLMTLILLLAHLLAPVVAAHPLGNFTINHYAGLQVTRQAMTIDYVLDMAEIPAFQEIATFDTNGNGQPDPDEAARYHPAQCAAIRAGLELRRDGQPLSLTLASSTLEFPAGAGGLPTLRLTCAFRSPLAELTEPVQIEFQNKLYAERLGWREVVVSGEGVLLSGELTGLTNSVSQRLTAYPDDLLSNPLDQRRVSFNLSPLNDSSQPSNLQPSNFPTFQPSTPPTLQPSPDRNDGFTRLINAADLSPLTILLALAVAFGWGTAHALTPGHGKTIVAAYLVGSRGTVRHALFLGLTTTVTHTAGVFVLGFLTLFASEFILPERLYPWLGVASGLLVVGMGWSLFRGRLRQLVGSASHPYDHHHPHDHDHFHKHNHDGHIHSHLPPGGDGAPVTWRGLLALGVSGGLIPCPSALVVMLSAIALQRIGFGLLLIVAFSLGLAGVLTAIGIVWVHAGRLFGRVPAGGRLLRVVPVLSALFISVVGLGIVLQALIQTGALPSEMSTAITLAAARASALF
jgi:ABC-type nickel/cobalt efflux system permease component RcnA